MIKEKSKNREAPIIKEDMPDPSDEKELQPPRQRNFFVFKSLQYRDYRWLWLGTFAAFMAISMQMVNRGWLVLRLTNDSPFALSIVMMSFAFPMIFVPLLGGALADRLSRKQIIILTQSGNVVLTLLLATLDLTDLIRFWHLIVIGFLNGTMASFNMPSRQSIISDIVPAKDLMNAVSLNSSGMNMTRIVGPALAGVLIIFIDTAGVFYLIAFTYAVSVFFMTLIREDKKTAEKSGKGVSADILEGLKYARRNSTLLGLLILMFLPSLFGFPYIALLPAWAREVLNAQSDGLGLLMMSMGVGSLVGTLLLASLNNLRRRGIFLLATGFVWGLSMAVSSQCLSYATALCSVFFLGFLSSFFMALNMSLLQIYSSVEMRGRINSMAMMAFGIMPLSVIPFGAVAERMGTDVSLMIAGIILSLFTLAFFIAYPKFRKVE
ncbi:MFS transporter [Thermodesulfobacteriota bacterium]